MEDDVPGGHRHVRSSVCIIYGTVPDKIQKGKEAVIMAAKSEKGKTMNKNEKKGIHLPHQSPAACRTDNTEHGSKEFCQRQYERPARQEQKKHLLFQK